MKPGDAVEKQILQNLRGHPTLGIMNACLEELRRLADDGSKTDPEAAHRYADGVLSLALIACGHGDIAEEWRRAREACGFQY